MYAKNLNFALLPCVGMMHIRCGENRIEKILDNQSPHEQEIPRVVWRRLMASS